MDIKTRIGVANDAFWKHKELSTDKETNAELLRLSSRKIC